MNTKAYSLEVSNDGEKFTPVLNVDDNTKAISNDAFPVTKARYVRLNIIQPTQGADSAARIYEVSVKGLDGNVDLPPVINPDDSNKPVDPDKPVNPDKPNNPENPDNPGNTDKPFNPDQPGDSEKPENPNKPGDTENSGEKPSEPSALVSKEITENSALLSWKAHEKVDLIKEYVIYQDGKEIGRVPADKTPLEFLAKYLKPNTKYNFQVSSIDKSGKESDKISLEITTNKKDNGNLPNTGLPIGAGALATTGIALSSTGVYLTLKKKKENK